MWVNKALFDMIVQDNKAQQTEITQKTAYIFATDARMDALRQQKTKDDLHIDWLRHRVNALEKQNTILMGKATGLAFPTPEIVPTRPGTIGGVPDFDTMPSFEDVGDDEAQRLGVAHDFEGRLAFKQ